MFNIFKIRKPKLSSKKPVPEIFQYKVIGPSDFYPLTSGPGSWGHVWVPLSIWQWILEVINIKDIYVGRLKFINGDYSLVYHFRNEADAVAFKMEFN